MHRGCPCVWWESCLLPSERLGQSWNRSWLNWGYSVTPYCWHQERCYEVDTFSVEIYHCLLWPCRFWFGFSEWLTPSHLISLDKKMKTHLWTLWRCSFIIVLSLICDPISGKTAPICEQDLVWCHQWNVSQIKLERSSQSSAGNRQGWGLMSCGTKRRVDPEARLDNGSPGYHIHLWGAPQSVGLQKPLVL